MTLGLVFEPELKRERPAQGRTSCVPPFEPSLRNKHGVSGIVLPENELLPYSYSELQACCQSAHLHLAKLGLYSDGPLEVYGDAEDSVTPTSIS